MSNRESQLVRGMGLMADKFNERTKMFQFLSIFHPEIPLEKRLKMVNDETLKDTD
jgi:hypothetical protein